MGSWSKSRLFILLWLLTSLYIAILPTRHYTPDAVNNLTYLEAHNGFESWHSQHLLGLKPGEWVYGLTSFRAWQAMRIAQALLGGLTVALLFLGLEELTHRRWLSLICALSLCFSYGFWHYSSDPDIYSLGYVAIALLMWAYVRFLRLPSTKHVIVLSISAALALLSHQINVELAGLIGLSLIIGTLRKSTSIPINWKHVVLYAALSLIPTLLLYILAWLTVNGSFAQQGLPTPTFAEWFLRYFRSAEAGQATWGVSFGLSTLPTVIYTLLSSWILVPLLGGTPLWQFIPIAIFGLLLIVVFVRVIYKVTRSDSVAQYVLWVSLITLVANGISGWWWQTGNIKFYLFMQINIIYIFALYVSKILECESITRPRELLLPIVTFILLIGFHLTLTLPYETRGGVFEVADHLKDQQTVVAFQDPYQRRILPYITNNQAEDLPTNFCNVPIFDNDHKVWWVVRQDTVASCPLLASATELSRFQVDRTRSTWVLFDMTSELKTK